MLPHRSSAHSTKESSHLPTPGSTPSEVLVLIARDSTREALATLLKPHCRSVYLCGSLAEGRQILAQNPDLRSVIADWEIGGRMLDDKGGSPHPSIEAVNCLASEDRKVAVAFVAIVPEMAQPFGFPDLFSIHDLRGILHSLYERTEGTFHSQSFSAALSGCKFEAPQPEQQNHNSPELKA